MATTKRNDKKQKYERQAEILQVLAHPIRVAIANLLRNGEVCVCNIAERIGAERPNVSRHLAIMLRSGVVQTRKEGLQVFYSLRTKQIARILDAVEKSAREIVRQNAKALLN